ncbi:hypothetical protein HYN69_18610 (plasmid) [Gemmobacter aquarius]|uniref:Uncharacterized protein n=1 Tax=Paragemmobacter aquarius TaxID=2169400 RepID=A0A2S0US26_9RHOB|nr:hypothetical protein HYN69_18610 [Gemmobacter aquarius]
MARLVVAATEQPTDGLTDRRAEAARLTRLIMLAPMRARLMRTRLMRTRLAPVLTGLTTGLPVATLAAGHSTLLVAYLAAHAGRSAADVGHPAALVLTGMLLAGLCIDAIALTAIILLASPAAHRLAVALTVATRAILPAIAAATRMICSRRLAIPALRLAITGLPVRLLGLIAALALAILLALLIVSLLAVLLRLAAIFVAVVVATLAVTFFMVRHRCSSV